MNTKKLFFYASLLFLLALLSFSLILIIKPELSLFWVKQKVQKGDISYFFSHAYRTNLPDEYQDRLRNYAIRMYENQTLLRPEPVDYPLDSIANGFFVNGLSGINESYVYFSATDNSNPITNGKTYFIWYPHLLLTRSAGIVYLVCILGWLAFLAGAFALQRQRASAPFIQAVNPVSNLRGWFSFLEEEWFGFRILYNSLREEPSYNKFCITGGFILFVIALIRAGTTGITYDEAFTYLTYSKSPTGFLAINLPNNHQLNSLLIYLLNVIFPSIKYSEFLIRLPSLLFYLLFLLIAARIGKLFKHSYLVFALLVTNYFLSEFFGLARGYGMSAALILAAFYVYYRNPKNDRTINKTIYLLLLADFANPTALLISACFFLYMYLVDIKPVHTFAYMRKNALHLLAQISAFAAMVAYLLMVTGGGDVPVGVSSFFHAIPLSLAQNFTYQQVISRILAVGLIGYFLLGIAVLRQKISAKPAVFVFLLFVLLAYLVAKVTHKAIATERLILPLWPVCALAIAEIFEYLECELFHKRSPDLVFTGVSSILVLLMIANFFVSTRFTYTKFSKADYPLRAVMYDAAIHHKKADPKYYNMVAIYYSIKIENTYGYHVYFEGQ